jgi:hypothetical protein
MKLPIHRLRDTAAERLPFKYLNYYIKSSITRFFNQINRVLILTTNERPIGDPEHEEEPVDVEDIEAA